MFNSDQISKLEGKLLTENIKQRQGAGRQSLSYVPSPYVIKRANEIFGFGNWGDKIIELTQLAKTEYTKTYNNVEKSMTDVSYSCVLRLTVTDEKGNTQTHEDVGFGSGSGNSQPSGVNAATELAIKESVTDALKRCLRKYGDQFGLALYEEGLDNVTSGADLEAAKPVTVEQLEELRALYEPRCVNDEWLNSLLKAQGYSGQIDDMNQEWFEFAISSTRKYKLEEVKKATYDEDQAKTLKLMGESANINMLKALYAEAFNRAKSYDDSAMLKKVTELKDKIKQELEK